jgi:malectin (di-glucose binding ER protein)/carboxypeptidase family protein
MLVGAVAVGSTAADAQPSFSAAEVRSGIAEGGGSASAPTACPRKGNERPLGIATVTQRAGHDVSTAPADDTLPAGGSEFVKVDGVFAPPGAVGPGGALDDRPEDTSSPAASDCARQVPVTDFPAPLARDGDRVYVGHSWRTNKVSVMDISTPGSEAVAETLDTPISPVDLAVANDELYVLDEFHRLSWRPLGGGAWQSIDLASGGGEQSHWGHGRTLFPHGDRMFVLHWENGGRISVVDLNTHAVVETITDVSFLPNDIVFLDDVMIVLSVGLTAPSCGASGPHFSVYDLTTLGRVFSRDIAGDCPVGSAVVGDRYFVAFNDTIREYDPATGSELNRISGGAAFDWFLPQIVVYDRTMYLTTREGDVLRVSPGLSELVFLCNVLASTLRTFPPVQAISLDASSSRLFVANLNDDTVSIADLTRPPPTVGTVAGVLTDRRDGSRVAGARLTFTSGTNRFVATSGPDGAYSIELDKGAYDLDVAADGYAAAADRVTVVGGKTSRHNFPLSTGVVSASSDRLALTAEYGGVATTNITVTNNGNTAMTVELSDDAPWLSSDTGPVILEPGTSESFALVADAHGLSQASYAAALLVTGNPAKVSQVEVWVRFDVAAPYSIAVNVGGGRVVDGAGVVWRADKGYVSGGGWGRTGTSVRDVTIAGIAGTVADRLYQDRRIGGFGYRFDGVPAGTYRIRLLFAELRRQVRVGDRKISVFVEGQRVLANHDVVGHAGQLTADQHTVTVQHTGGTLVVNLQGVAGLEPPMLNALRILQTG